MRPDRTNYEIWIIDYLDGTLDEVQIRQLFSFLDENPDIKEEFEEFSQYYIIPGIDTFQNKNELKKTIADLSENQFEILCVKACEKDLSDRQRHEFETIIAQNPGKRKTYEIFKRLKLVAPAVKYNYKSRLRKLTATQKIIRLSAIGLSAAAGIAIMVSLFNLPVNKKEELKTLSAINPTGDSFQAKTVINNNPAVTISGEKKEIIKTSPVKMMALLQKTVSDEMKAFPGNSQNNISSSGESEIRNVTISKIGFKQDIILIEKEYAGNYIAINTHEIPSMETPEKPGFNDFIARAFREKIFKSKTPETGSLKAYEIADAGINGLNKLLGWQMSLQKTRDENGDLKSLYFNSKILKFNAPVNKAQLLP
jgi:hypothetical protein